MNYIYNPSSKNFYQVPFEKNLSGKNIFSLEAKGRLKKPKTKICEVEKPKQNDVVISLKDTIPSISSTKVGFEQKMEQNRRSLELDKVKSENKVAADSAKNIFDLPDNIWAIANKFKV